MLERLREKIAMRTWRTIVMSAAMLGVAASAEDVLPETTSNVVYLFSSFRGNGEDGLHLAYSLDGLKWSAMKNDQPFLKPLVGGKLMRDPCIIQGPDGIFHLVWTTSWHDQGIGIAHSKDLVNWTEQRFVPVMKHESKARNCWAPEITWDPDGKQYVIYWATSIPDRFLETAKSGDNEWNHRMYCTTSKDFKSYTPTRLFYEPGFNVIDATIVRDGDRHVMILKDETRHPAAKNLRIATSNKVTGPWSAASEPFSPKGLWVEGPSCLKVGKQWVVYYDEYTRHEYGAMRTTDFKNWEIISDKLTFPKQTRHGTAFAVTADVLEKLLVAVHGDVDSVVRPDDIGKPNLNVDIHVDQAKHVKSPSRCNRPASMLQPSRPTLMRPAGRKESANAGCGWR